MKAIKTLVSVLFLSGIITFGTGCGKDSGGSSGGGAGASGDAGSVLQGIDMSGHYIFTDVSCFANTTYALTVYAPLTSTSPSASIVINRNAYVETDTSQTCIGVTQATVVFESNGNFSLKNQHTTTSTHSSCTFTWTINNALAQGGTITPATLSGTLTDNGSPANITGTYIKDSNTGDIGLFSTFHAVGRPSDLCFMFMTKQ